MSGPSDGLVSVAIYQEATSDQECDNDVDDKRETEECEVIYFTRSTESCKFGTYKMPSIFRLKEKLSN